MRTLAKPTDTPDITAYIVAYNHEKYIEEAIESVLMQETSYTCELVIADDCSTDNTRAIIMAYAEKYPALIRTFFPEQNMGNTRICAAVRQAGLWRGRYMAHLEGDDYWLRRDRLQVLVGFLEQHPEYTRVSHVRETRDMDGKLIGYQPEPEVIGKRFTLDDFLAGKRCSLAASVYRNYHLIAGERYYALETVARNVQDYQQHFISNDFGDIYVMDECFGVYRWRNRAGEDNYNSLADTLSQYRDHNAIMNALDDYYERRYDLSGERLRLRMTLLRNILRTRDKEAIAEFKNTVPERERDEVWRKTLEGAVTRRVKGLFHREG